MTTTHDAPPAYEPLPEDADQWTAKIRRKLVRALPPDRMVPDRQPAYLSSWIYIFGALTMSALAVVIITGTLLALEGPAWWHLSTVGLFVNSLHLWSVELFFFFMVIHLWGKFFMAAWRGNRTLTWMTGVITFMASIGAGAFFNVLNFGQMLMWHIMILPLAVVALTVLHILLVRTKGIVPPFEIASPEGGAHADATAETAGGEG